MNTRPAIAVFLPADSADLPYLRCLVTAARRLGLEVEVPREIHSLPELGAECAGECRGVEVPSAGCRMVLSIGGDGTFLRAARWTLQGNCAPVAGINAGSLGFLASWERDDYTTLLQMASTYRIPTRQRSLLQVSCPALAADTFAYALNEVSILRSETSQMITVEASLQGSPLTEYTGDGLIACTATGSTGYNLSAGGPILQPDLPAIVLTPVAPHALTQRPLVIGGDSVLRLRVRGRSSSFLLSVDGCSQPLPIGSPVEITRAPITLSTVHNASEDFASRLRAKLMWGENPVPR